MEGMSVADYMAVAGSKDGTWTGNGGFLWVILIFLFFLGFSGGGLFGNNRGDAYTARGLTDLERDVLKGNSDTQRDILVTSCNTQKEILESRYATQLGFQAAQAQLASCCCDLKTAIHAEGEATRSMIQEDKIQQLRDQVYTTNLALQNQTLANNIVNQVRPFPTPAYITCSPYTTAYGYFGNNCGGCNNNLV